MLNRIPCPHHCECTTALDKKWCNLGLAESRCGPQSGPETGSDIVSILDPVFKIFWFVKLRNQWIFYQAFYLSPLCFRNSWKNMGLCFSADSRSHQFKQADVSRFDRMLLLNVDFCTFLHFLLSDLCSVQRQVTACNLNFKPRWILLIE